MLNGYEVDYKPIVLDVDMPQARGKKYGLKGKVFATFMCV